MGDIGPVQRRYDVLAIREFDTVEATIEVTAEVRDDPARAPDPVRAAPAEAETDHPA